MNKAVVASSRAPGSGANRILPPFPPVSKPDSGAGEGLSGGAVNGSHPGHHPPPPTAIFPLAGDARVDSASEGGAESEHVGIGFT